MRFNKLAIDDLKDNLKKVKINRDHDSDYETVKVEIIIENDYDSDAFSGLAEQVSD